MSPSPPGWIRIAITACSKRVKCEPVSTTTSPVTVTADAEVKIASPHPVPPWLAAGSISSTAPRATSTA